MVINHLEKLFVTSDASTITAELEVQHPAAKLLVMAAQAQQQEIGDGTNMVRRLLGQLMCMCWKMGGSNRALLGAGPRTMRLSSCAMLLSCHACIPHPLLIPAFPSHAGAVVCG